MIRSIETNGKTEEDARRAALEQLGLPEDADVSVTVLERAKSGFLGIIGGTPAKVRVTYEVPDEEPAPKTAPKSAPAPKAAPRAAEKPAPIKPAAPKAVPQGDEVERVRTFLLGLFERMGVEAQVDAVYNAEDNTVSVELSGERVGALIGRRGETLDAIQHLANYMLNNGSDERTRVNVDAENYRAKRADTLTSVAQKTAAKVVRYRRNQTLEPMNAYERHVIHTALQDYPGVTTYSTGTEPNRRVVVAYEASTAPRDTYERTDSRPPRRDDRRDSRPRRSSNGGYASRANFGSPAAPAPEKPPVDKTVKEWS